MRYPNPRLKLAFISTVLSLLLAPDSPRLPGAAGDEALIVKCNSRK
jgi:hypothetical protein